MRRKEWVLVEVLQSKIDLALSHRLIRDWADLAERLNTREKTIRSWVQERAGHEAGEMPREAFGGLCDLFATELADESRIVVENLVAGPVAHLADAVAANRSGAGLLPFLREAVTGEAKLVAYDHDPGLVEINRKADGMVLPVVALHAPFRIEFKPMHRLRGIIVLQNAGLHWATIEANADRKRTAVFVPGLDSDGLALTMAEHEQTGSHRFYCIQSARPLSAALRAELGEPIVLDRRVLGMVARFYDQFSPTERRCQVMELRVDAARIPA